MKLTVVLVLLASLRGLCLGAEAPAVPAFPGAEGFGATSTGGRGGKVIKVTTLEPKGPGSLQAACETEGPRIVVFEVAGVIKGNIDIKHPNITIAGQTAPGAGITIEGMLKNPYRIKPNLHDVTIRFVRVRPPRRAGKWSGGDCLQLTDIDRLIIDHVSCSWGSDENMDLCNSRDFTVQWCAIEESDTEGHEKGQHNFGMIMGYAGKDATVHHNLFAHHSNRAPLCGLEILDHRNNLIYNVKAPLLWHPVSMNSQRPGHPFRANIVGNYFKAGPDSPRDAKTSSLDQVMWKRETVEPYCEGNFFEWTDKVAESKAQPRAEKPWPAPAVTTHPAKEAADLVIAHAGCLPRDVVSRRTIEEVLKGVGAWGRHDPPEGLMHGLKAGAAPKDADNDGMPDEWETRHGLNPNDAADANKVVPKGASADDRHAGYTWIEFYVNELADSLVAAAIEAAKERKRVR